VLRWLHEGVARTMVPSDANGLRPPPDCGGRRLPADRLPRPVMDAVNWKPWPTSQIPPSTMRCRWSLTAKPHSPPRSWLTLNGQGPVRRRERP
jgi:hypothetical protein